MREMCGGKVECVIVLCMLCVASVRGTRKIGIVIIYILVFGVTAERHRKCMDMHMDIGHVEGIRTRTI